MPRRRSVLALVLAVSAVLALSPFISTGCRKAPKEDRGRRGPVPAVSPYHPPTLPTVVWPTPRPGQPTRRPTLPG